MITTWIRNHWAALLALLLVPLLAVGALLGISQPERDDQITAAVVNLDEAVTIEGQIVPLGRQLTAAVVARDGENIDWTLADVKNAEEGLGSGKYSAVITIPKNFSAAATSFSANDAAKAEQAVIDIEVSDNSPIADAVIAQEIAGLAIDTINATLTEGYLDNVFLGINTFKEQLTTIADGARQLSDGTAELADGVHQTVEGANQLSDGMSLLADNAGKLSSGGQELADGSYDYADGVAKYADGVKQLDAGIQQFNKQLPQLVAGIDKLVTESEPLLTAIPDYTAGAKEALQGVGALKGGLDQVIAGLNQPQDFSDLQKLADGADQVADGVEQLNTELQKVAGFLQDLEEQLDFDPAEIKEEFAKFQNQLEQADELLAGYADGSISPPAEISQIPDQIMANFQCPVDDPETCAALEKSVRDSVTQAVNEGFKTASGTAHDVLTRVDPTTGESLQTRLTKILEEIRPLVDQAQDLVEQINGFFTGIDQLASGARQVADGVQQLADELPKKTAEQTALLKNGLQQISNGAGDLMTGAQPLIDNADALGDGSTQLLSGMQQLNSEVTKLPAGVQQLANGSSQLASGGSDLADGGYQLASGIQSYANGVGQYADGVISAAAGVQQFADGIAQLDDGAAQLADGVNTFATQLEDGADQVPSYSSEDRARLAQVVASPLDKSDDLISGGRLAFVLLLLTGALWLTALSAFVVVKAVPQDIVSSRLPTAALWARTIAVPAGLTSLLGLTLGAIGWASLGLSFGRGLGLMIILAALGVTFALANHALSAWLGNTGRGISLLLLALTIAVAVSSTVAAWVSGLAGLSPLHNGFELARAFASDGSGLVGFSGMALLMLAVSAGVSYWTISRRRILTSAQFRNRLQRAA